MKTGSQKNMVRKDGFTLVEVMVAAALSLLLIASIIATSTNLQTLLKTQNAINEMQQNVRATADMLSRDLRTAGYGLDDDASAALTDWIDWIGGFNSNPLVVDGGAGPDTVYIAGAFTDPIGYLAADLPMGSTVIPLDSGGDAVNTGDRKVIIIGQVETARVLGTSGNTLTISSHPTASSGLAYSFSAGVPIEVVSVITYQVVDSPSLYPYGPHLQRIDSTVDTIYDWQKMAAGNIDDLQVVDNGTTMDIQIQGRSAKPLYLYTDPEVGDHYRRYRLSTTIHRRN